jgi:dTDP-4-dehydrorhamnose 3,5-epimerase
MNKGGNMTEYIQMTHEVVGVNQALRLSAQERKPILLPIEVHQDSRGWSFVNMLQDFNEFGQFNFSHINQGAVKGWHKHKYQHDLWIVTRGDLKVGVIYENGAKNTYGEWYDKTWQAVIGEHNPSVLVIPPGLWHGCSAISGPVDLLYCVTKIFNRDAPDEKRKSYRAFTFNWDIEHG